MKTPYIDDSDLTEITILPDGRLYVFGLSERIEEVLRLLERQSIPASGDSENPIACEVTTYHNAGEGCDDDKR